MLRVRAGHRDEHLAGDVASVEIVSSLTGATVPNVALQVVGVDDPTCLDALDTSLVVYFYPGCSTSAGRESDTPLVDAEQHRGFRDLRDDFAARHVTVVGVSSQPIERQQGAIAADRLPHLLARDGALQFADALGLPTFRLGAERFFQRLTLVVKEGVIWQVFFPITAPGRHAAEVAARLRAVGI
jgi:peroxiredoxin